MNKDILKLSFIALAVLFVACNKRGNLDKLDLPEWVFDPYAISKDSTELAAVGIAEKSEILGLKEQIEKASLDGIGNLATQIKVRVDKVVEDSVTQEISGQSGKTAGAVAAQTAKLEVAMKKFSAVTKSVVDGLDISGFRRKEMYESPKDGTLYVRVVIDIKKVENHFKNNVKMYNELKAMGVNEATIKKLTDRTLGAGFSQEAMKEQVKAETVKEKEASAS